MLKNNIHDTALIFEGGGMRASFSAAVLNRLLAEGLYFNYVCGVSAGATCTVNYLSRDPLRSRRCFVELVDEPDFGGLRSMLRGRGFFNAERIYEGMLRDVLPFDLATFKANPADCRISAVAMGSARTRTWGKAELGDAASIVKAVRASSTLPLLMPPPRIDGEAYLDGGLYNGIELERARSDGYRRFVLVLTRERGYRKRTQASLQALLLWRYRRYPGLLKLIRERVARYNRTLEELDALERRGQAFIIAPERMDVSGFSRNRAALEENFLRGARQMDRVMPALSRFLAARGER